MSEEELNQELKADELKDVSGGFSHHANVDKMAGDVGAAVKGDLKIGDLLGKKGKKNTNYDCQDLSGNP